MLDLIDVQKLATYLVGAIIIFFLGVFFNNWLGKRKEYREYSKWQFGNVKDIFFDKYLSGTIMECRERVKKSKDNNPKAKDKYELTIALQQLGINAYLGIIPIEPILAGNAPQVVSDFVLVLDHIEAIRETEINNNSISFQRRHGEWLACICFMWLCSQKFNLTTTDKDIIKDYLNIYGSLNKIKEREKKLFNSEINFVKIHTKNITKQIRFNYFKYRILSKYIKKGRRKACPAGMSGQRTWRRPSRRGRG